MSNISSIITRIDKVANSLESKSLTKQAMALDKVANTLEKTAGLDSLAKKILKKIPIGKALTTLMTTPGWDEKLPLLMSEIQRDLAANRTKTAGLLNVVKNPVKLAVLALMLYAGNAQATGGLETSPKIIAGMVEHMPLPSNFEMAILKSGMLNIDVFKDKLSDTITETLNDDSDLSAYLKAHYTNSKENLKKDLIKAFELKLKQNPDKARILVAYINKKSINNRDRASALNLVKSLVRNAITEGTLKNLVR